MFALKLSFVLRYQLEVPRSVFIPLEKLVGIDLAGDDTVHKVLAAILDDDDLMRELFGDYMHEYRGMADHAETYWKDLMRFREELVIVQADKA